MSLFDRIYPELEKFDESKVRRDEDGKFATTGAALAAGSGVGAVVGARIGAMRAQRAIANMPVGKVGGQFLRSSTARAVMRSYPIAGAVAGGIVGAFGAAAILRDIRAARSEKKAKAAIITAPKTGSARIHAIAAEMKQLEAGVRKADIADALLKSWLGKSVTITINDGGSDGQDGRADRDADSDTVFKEKELRRKGDMQGAPNGVATRPPQRRGRIAGALHGGWKGAGVGAKLGAGLGTALGLYAGGARGAAVGAAGGAVAGAQVGAKLGALYGFARPGNRPPK